MVSTHFAVMLHDRGAYDANEGSGEDIGRLEGRNGLDGSPLAWMHLGSPGKVSYVRADDSDFPLTCRPTLKHR